MLTAMSYVTVANWFAEEAIIGVVGSESVQCTLSEHRRREIISVEKLLFQQDIVPSQFPVRLVAFQ